MKEKIDRLSSQLVDEMARLQPTEATFGGVVGYDDRWDDFSPEGHEVVSNALTAARGRFEAVDPGDDRWAILGRRVALDYIDREQLRFVDDDHLANLNNLASPLQAFSRVFDVMDTSSVEGWSAIASRLESLGTATAGYQRLLELGRSRGKTVARRQVEAAIEQGRALAKPASSLGRLPGELSSSGISAAGLEQRVAAGVRAAIAAVGDLATYLEATYLESARVSDPVGEERYARATRSFLGTEIDPRETYDWGWTEIAKLRTEMIQCAGEIESGASLAQVLALLKTDPARSANLDRFIELMQERQESALQSLDGTHFDVPSSIRSVEIKLSPPGGALGAYYIPPSEDFKRAGSVWYSPGDHQTMALYDQISTAYHEGFPGHHLQCGIQVALADRLTRLHRSMYWYAGYGEGWALYTERLMQELGYYDRPDYVFGMLANEMLRACRVVIDIGSHLELEIPADQPFHPGERWTFETAVELLKDYGTMEDDYARSEVTRYLGWPGQAISYKVGQRAIFELRDELKRRQGASFDLKEFHGRVLNSGPLSLDMLREIVLAD